MWALLKRGVGKIIGRNSPPPPATKAREDAFETYKREHRDVTFAQFYAAQAMQNIRRGKAHSTLGLKLYEKQADGLGTRDFLEAGRAAALRYRKLCGFQRTSRVVDYGCGSLRLGIHFIEFLDAGNYMGLDVTRDFIDIGVSAVPELVEKKKPHLYAIDNASLAKASEFGADFVISKAVSYHVHPDEIGTYLGNLAAICVKPGARLVFDVKCSATQVRLRNRSWAHPLDFYVEHLKPLRFVKQHAVMDHDLKNASAKSSILEFRRD